MCIQTAKERLIAQKAELDAKLAKLDAAEGKTVFVKSVLTELLQDYSEVLPEELSDLWQGILAMGSQYNLAVQPLAADELRQWERANAENERLKQEDQETKRQYVELLEISGNRVKELQGEIEKEKYNYQTLVVIGKVLNQQLEKAYAEVEDLRWQLAQMMQPAEPKLEQGQKEDIAPGLEKLWQEALTESAEAPEILTIDSILEAKGFFQPPDLEDYSNSDKHETYRGWDIYYGIPNGGIISIGLYNAEYNQPWDVSTEYIQEIDPTFPESLADYGEIVAWTRALIDQVENLQAPGQLALEFPEPEPEAVLTGEEYNAAVGEELTLDNEEIPELGGNWEDDAEPTKLQKVLFDNNSNFVFEPAETGANVQTFVSIHSQIAPADDTVDFATEEARFDVAIFEGGFQGDYEKAEYFLDAQTFLYHHRVDIRQTALGYAKFFWQELEKKAEIKEKVARWNADTTLLSNQVAPEPIAESTTTESANPETETNFEAMGFTVQVYPQYADGKNLAGATFRFLNAEHTLVFDSSRLAAEIGDRTWKVCAYDLIQDYRDKEATRAEKLANPHKKPEDDFIEFVRLSPAVGYIKRRDNGELISAYAAFANRDAAGEKIATMAKPRAKKWAEHLHASFESCGWKVEEPRKVKRMQSKPGAKQVFAYEIKITGKFSIGQLQKMSEEDFSLLPNEIAAKPVEPVTAPSAPNLRVVVNGFEMASGKGYEVLSRFEEELAEFGDAGKTSVSLMRGSEVVERYAVADFNFIEAQDFDAENPEYWVLHRPTQTNFRVYRSLASGANWVNSIYPHNPLSTKEAAAVDRLRRQLKTEKAE